MICWTRGNSLVQLRTLLLADGDETKSLTGAFPNPIGVDCSSNPLDFIIRRETHPPRDVFHVLTLGIESRGVQIAKPFLHFAHKEVDLIPVDYQAWVAIELEPELRLGRMRESHSEHVGVSSSRASPVVLVDDEVGCGEVAVEAKIPSRKEFVTVCSHSY
jgi:hypothetical protein